jgi:hypothetical protein
MPSPEKEKLKAKTMLKYGIRKFNRETDKFEFVEP